MSVYASFLLATLISVCCRSSSNSAFKIGTWNSFDILSASERDSRRDYFLANTDELFGELDILCTQESFSYQSITDYVTNFNGVFPYSYYNDDPSTSTASGSSPSTYQACLSSEIAFFTDNTSVIYDCHRVCMESLPSISYIFCLWRCFGELRDDSTGLTTRGNNPELFNIGKVLELSPCFSCLWKLKYVEKNLTESWTANNSTTSEIFDDILNMCSSTTNTVDYKSNEGVILFSKYEFDDVQFMPLADSVFIPRGAVIGTFNDHTNSDFIAEGQSLSIICAHLETPTVNFYFGSAEYTTMIQDNIDHKVTQLSNITEVNIKQLTNEINTIAANGGNVVILGDFNVGVNSRMDLYDELLSHTGLRNVFGASLDDATKAINCSRCESNPYADNHEIIDHILVKDMEAIASFDVLDAKRFLDGTYNHDTSGELKPLSDHYGIMAELQMLGEKMPAEYEEDETWMIVAIVFIVLFAVALFAVILMAIKGAPKKKESTQQ